MWAGRHEGLEPEPESEPQLEGLLSDSESDSGEPEPEPELLADSDDDKPEAEPELLADGVDVYGGTQPRTIFDQTDDGWIASAQRGFAGGAEAEQQQTKADKAAARMQWWREKARKDIAARLKDGAAPLPAERQPPVDLPESVAEPVGRSVGACTARPSPADSDDGATSDGETASASHPEEEQQEEGEEEEEEGWNEEDEEASRERELQEMRSEFSDLQDLVKRMRSPSAANVAADAVADSPRSLSSRGTSSLRTRSVQEIESQIEASVGLEPPPASPAGKEAEVAGWLVTRRLARAEELIVELESVTVDEESATIVSSPFEVQRRPRAAAAAAAPMQPRSDSRHNAAATAGVGSGPPRSKRKPRRSPGQASTPTVGRARQPRESAAARSSARDSNTAARKAPSSNVMQSPQRSPSRVNHPRGAGISSASSTPRRSAQRPGARGGGGGGEGATTGGRGRIQSRG